jgi:hypothetical protein
MLNRRGWNLHHQRIGAKLLSWMSKSMMTVSSIIDILSSLEERGCTVQDPLQTSLLDGNMFA